MAFLQSLNGHAAAGYAPRRHYTCYYRTLVRESRHSVRPVNPSCVLYIGIPAYNEATTIGVLLWRLRSVLAEVSREYEVVVYDDASTDQTAETLAPYSRVLPLTVIRGTQRLGYAGATDALVRHVARTTRYPRRDALLLLQGDFTDPPALVPEFLRRFEGGADLVIGERVSSGDAPKSVRRLWQASRWVLRPFVGISDVRDLTTSFRLVRIAVLRDLIKASGDAPIVAGDAWSANADFLLRTAPHARRVETIPVTPTFTVRTRESRRAAWPDAIALAKWGWSRRGQRIAAKVIVRAVEAVETDDPSAPDVVERAPRERPSRERTPRERPAAERATADRPAVERPSAERASAERPPRERAPRERPPRERVAREESTPRVESAPMAAAAEGEPKVAPAEGEVAPRPARKRRKRGARRDRTTLRAGGEESGEGDDIETSTSERAERADAPNADSADAGDSTPDVAEVAGEAPSRRKRSRRGRRRRGEGRSVNGAESSDATGESNDAESEAALEPREQPARRARTDSEENTAEERGDGESGVGADGDEAARKRRRSRRGRRGGSRKRTNGSPGEGEPREGGSDAGESAGGPLEGA
jgi:glycosyltransferase involved in cell wall biosynthesis